MKKKVSSFVLILSMVCATYGQGYFTIIGPQTHQVGKPYRAFLTATGYDRERVLQISLSHKDYQPAVETVTLKNDVEREISINFVATTDISNLILRAEYTDTPGTVFEETIKVITKKYSVLIQTDKAVYKPGDKVHFRVIVLDADLKPYPYNSLGIAFGDGLKQKVASRSASQSEFGVYEDSLQLADELNFGKWAILVYVDGKKNGIHKQNFEVVNYQLPQFEVTVEVEAKDVLLATGQIRGEVFAKYAFAKGATFVKGEPTLIAKIFDPENLEIPQLTKTLRISGAGDKKSFIIDLRGDLGLNGQLNQTLIKLEANFKDDLTKRSFAGSTSLIVHKTPSYTFEILEGKKFMIPRHPYRMKIQVKGFDGKVVQGNKKLTVKSILYTKLRDCGRDKTLGKFGLKLLPQQNIPLRNGVVDVNVDVADNSEAILFNLKLGDNFLGEFKVFRHPTKTAENLDLSVVPSLKRGEDVEVKVLSTHGMQKLHSVVIGRSGIVHSQTDDVDGIQNFDLRFKPTSRMLPSSKLIVYYIQSTGEVVYDQVELNFDTWTGNFIDINAPESAEPNQKVEISIATSPYSFVGMMAVDKRSSFLATGNDIDESKMQAAISSFTFSDVFSKSEARTLYSSLGEANAVILTDATKGAYDCSVDRGSEDTYDSKVDEIPPNSGNVQFIGHQQSPKGFPETWLFKRAIANESGRLELQRTVPNTMTSYAISAFSINKEHGFGLATPQYLMVSKDFFVELNLPSSAFVDDVIKVDVFIFNHASDPKNLRATVKLEKTGDFEVYAPGAKSSSNLTPTKKLEKEVDIFGNGVAKTFFFIKPIRIGLLKLAATVRLNGQAEVTSSQNIFIEETGRQEGKTRAKLFDLRNREHDSIYFNMGSSDDAVEGSEQLEALVFGNVMGSGITTAISGSDGSTGEKILNYVAAAYSLQYLKATGQHDQIDDAKPKIEAGYQFVLSRKLSGGNRGYIANAGDEKASLLATAQVAKFLAIIRNFIQIQDANVVSALEFLKSKQATTGEFIIKDSTSEAVYGSASKIVADTALMALAFLENEPCVPRFKSQIKKSLDFISSKFDDAKVDEYTLAISAYALALGATKFLDELFKTANVDKVYTFLVVDTSSSQQISTAAYAILALEKLGRVVEAPNILNWLLSKREEDGSFQSSEDTVVGIQATAAMAGHFHSDHQNLNLYIYNENFFQKIKIFVDGGFAPQVYPVPTPSGASVNANGTGMSFVRMTKKYFVKSEQESKFAVTVHPQKVSDNSLKLKVCVNSLSGQSDLAVAEVRLPGGYEFNESAFDKSKVKSVFTSRNKSLVIVKFHRVQKKKQCVDINAVSFYSVLSSKPLSVKVYEQNDKDRFTLKVYTPPPTPIELFVGEN